MRRKSCPAASAWKNMCRSFKLGKMVRIAAGFRPAAVRILLYERAQGLENDGRLGTRLRGRKEDGYNRAFFRKTIDKHTQFVLL